MESAQLEHAPVESRTEGVRRTSLRRLKVENFKSFAKLDLTLPDFSAFIGPNGSGKSNLMEAIEFPYNIERLGLNNAILECGGNKCIRPFSAKTQAVLGFEFQIESSVPCLGAFLSSKNQHVMVGVSSLTYKFRLDLKDESGYTILSDEAEFEGSVFDDDHGFGKHTKITIKNINGNFEFVHDKNEKYVSKNRNTANKKKNNELMLHLPTSLFRPAISQMFDHAISAYDIHPKYAKWTTPSNGPSFLFPNASNLTLAVQELSNDPKKMRMFELLVKRLIPSISKIGTEKHARDELLFNLQEKYFEKTTTPANSVSDGSVRIIALVMALYFQDVGLKIIEEPERGIHPSLVSGIAHMAKDASYMGQVILTTHNPEVLKGISIDDLYLVSRNADGFSRVAKPNDVERVSKFLKADMGIDELYIHGILDNS